MSISRTPRRIAASLHSASKPVRQAQIVPGESRSGSWLDDQQQQQQPATLFSQQQVSKSKADIPPRLTFIGAGKMAEALVQGILAAGVVPPHLINVTCRRPDHATQLTNLFEGKLAGVWTDNFKALQGVDQQQKTLSKKTPISPRHVLFLTVKPQDLPSLCKSIAPHLSSPPPLIITASPGILASDIASWLSSPRNPADTIPIVRSMPNTPCIVRQGAVGLYANEAVTEQDRQMVERVFESVNPTVTFTSEKELNAVASTSGSGPAYFLYLMEIFESVGRELGFSSQTTRDLAIQACIGAGHLASESPNSSITELRQAIAPPGGSTQVAMNELGGGGFDQVVRRAIMASYKKNVGMGTMHLQAGASPSKAAAKEVTAS
ncbi:pyrroline-5-carboxylate reductase dimerization-domain-containing protein [Phlyctochytrium arcticum]|nr:pyrroline-5-carboxylate reductase dimerization-domain-containing protein [Phlyctochytrium arcticum]